MKTFLFARDVAMSAIGLFVTIFIVAQIGCSTNSAPSTQPVNTEQQAYNTTAALVQTAETAAALVAPFLPASDQALISTSEKIVNEDLATWQANMGQGLGPELDAEITSTLADLIPIIAKGKATQAGTTPATVSAHAKARHRQ